MFLVPSKLFAAFSITEIMYDPQGSDDGREWIEVYADISGDVDSKTTTLFEEGSHHKLLVSSSSPVSGTTIHPQEYFILSSNPEKFLADYPSFSKRVIKSSFSLKNSGESLAFEIDGVGESVFYTPESGAGGDGKSLHSRDGSWYALTPTPGEASSSDPAPLPENSSGASPATPISTTQSGESASPVITDGPGFSYLTDPHIFPKISTNPVSVLGARTIMRGSAVGLKGKVLDDARYLWNFGDGTTGEGITVAHQYKQEGIYIVALSATSGQYAGTAYQKIVVKKPTIVYSELNLALNSLALKNDGDTNIFLDGFQLVTKRATTTSFPPEKTYQFPPQSILAAHTLIRIDFSTLGFIPTDTLILFDEAGFPLFELHLEPEKSAGKVVSGSSSASAQTKNKTTLKKKTLSAPPAQLRPTPNLVSSPLARVDTIIPQNDEHNPEAQRPSGIVYAALLGALLLIIWVCATIWKTHNSLHDRPQN